MMPVRLAAFLSLALLCLALSGCGDEATLPVDAGTGPNPELPPPDTVISAGVVRTARPIMDGTVFA